MGWTHREIHGGRVREGEVLAIHEAPKALQIMHTRLRLRPLAADNGDKPGRPIRIPLLPAQAVPARVPTKVIR